MTNFIDYFLDRITMYRLVLYYLIVLLAYAFILSIFGILPYTPLSILLTTTLFFAGAFITNKIFSYVFEAPTNVESVYISALILALIITPTQSLHIFIPVVWIVIWAMASKYIFAINKKHIFNPVAVSIVITTFSIDQSASWWVGNGWMMPVVLLGGILIGRKIKRFSMIFSFLIAVFITSLVLVLVKNGDINTTIRALTLHSSLVFFAFIMLTEPLTTPPTKKLQIVYGMFVGFLFAPQISIFGLASTPELALILGNIFSYIVSPKQKLILKLQQKIIASSNVIDFIFLNKEKFNFVPGQYMEWTLPHPKTDSRGNRRYFTIASSPTEDKLRLGVKFYEKGSSYKQAMYNLNHEALIVGASLTGDFTLPKNPNKKIVFIAGGIGITPYRSMIKYLLDTKQKRPIILLYSNKIASEIAYQDIFNAAEKELGVRIIYALTDKESIPSGWQGRVGRIDSSMIKQEVPDYMERVFYLSGPQDMIDSYKNVLKNMGIKSSDIKTDYFPGLV